MRIAELYKTKKPVFSIELFPPKTPQGVENLRKKLAEIRTFRPDFISVTYGAGGGTRHTTREITRYIKGELGIEAMPHLTCVSHSRREIVEALTDLGEAGIENIMALRGDPPQGEESFLAPEDGFAHAIELVRELRGMGGFGIAVAGYPEGHVEAESYEQSLAYEVEKIKAGADAVVSQFFLDNKVFFSWRDDLRSRGVVCPVVAGILPAVSADQITRFAGMCGAVVPEALLEKLRALDDQPEAAVRAGLDHALAQIDGLLADGVDGIHLYALNRLEPIREVATRLGRSPAA
ncbi:MAG: methylenetetrahydrofolate reductase [Deltaproteobacteria bacterium]|nr:methylenetetrahydrofolate reductase [Deltaproteobacteria bacterium]